MKKKCVKCGGDKYTLNICDCDDCDDNGWYKKEEGYIYETPPEGEYRSQASDEGECAMGNSYNFGCWLLTCVRCGEQIHMPLVEE